MLLVLRYLLDPAPLPQMNSKQMKRLCEQMIDTLSDSDAVDRLFQDAKNVIDEVSGGNLERDNIRTLRTTKAIEEKLGRART